MAESSRKFILVAVPKASVRLHNEDDPRSFPDETGFRHLKHVPPDFASFAHAGYVAPINKPTKDQSPWNVRFGKRAHLPGPSTDAWIHFDESEVSRLLDIPDCILLIERRHAEEFARLCEQVGVNTQWLYHESELTI